MSDETLVAQQPQEATSDSTANIITEITKYRAYGKYGVNDKGETTVEALSVMGETKDQKNWKAAEEKGLTVLNETDIKFYSVSNEQGFIDLVPDADQRVYLINKGIAAVQSAAANAAMKDTDDKGVFVNNGQSVDLRDAINKAPERQVLSPEQKALKAFGALDAGAQARMLESLKALLAQGLQ